VAFSLLASSKVDQIGEELQLCVVGDDSQTLEQRSDIFRRLPSAKLSTVVE
jgi:hypothetical protein